jgi:tetratricopeptide (TPR) repeat protein
VIYKIVGDLKKSDDYRKKLLNFLETNPHLIEENPIHYIAALHNMLTQQLITHDYDNFKNYLHKLKTYDFKMPHERANVFSSLCLFELGYYSEIKEYKSAVRFVEETVVKYENVNDLINMEHRFLLNYQAALAYYHTQEYHKALKWVNKILGITNKDLRLDLRSSTYVLNVLTHYELNNFDLLPYLAKSTLAFLKTSKMLRKPDEIFLAIFNNTSLSLNKKEWIEFLTRKKNELLSTRSKSIIISDINYIEWIDRKLS